MSKQVTVRYVGPVHSKQDSVLIGVVIEGQSKSWQRSSVLELPPESLDELLGPIHEANRWAPAWQACEEDQPLF